MPFPPASRRHMLAALAASLPSGSAFAAEALGSVPQTAGGPEPAGKTGIGVNIEDFGASSAASAAVNTAAIQRAMKHLMDRFEGRDDFYPGAPGDPGNAGAVDYSGRDRRTGQIHIPAGCYRVQPEVFSSLKHPRAPFVGFEFVGEHFSASILLLETGGKEAYFYRSAVNDERYQRLTFRNLNFRSDDWRHGSFARVYSTGAAKQFIVQFCDFQNLQKYMHTEGIGNADLNLVIGSNIECHGDMLTLDNDQSVTHSFLGTNFRCWGNMVRVKRHGGGNVNIGSGFIDFMWDERFSPREGNFMFTHDKDANIGQGNCTFRWQDMRVEVEAYSTTPQAPPFGLVNCPESPRAFPRAIFDNVNFVGGKTYVIDQRGKIVTEQYRRITAVNISPSKHVEFRSCALLKSFFYRVSGDRDANSPHGGGILKFINCHDGTIGELPDADRALSNLHSRVAYSGSAGRVITEGMSEHTTGSSFQRKLLDADPKWRNSFAREPGSTKKITSFKHADNGWPFAANADNDHYLDIPPGFTALRIYVKKARNGSAANAYRLHLKSGDRTGATIASSALGQFKDQHEIDLSHADLSKFTRLCLCASGAGTDFDNGGFAYIEHV